MHSLHATPHFARLVLGTLAAVALLAAMSAVAASTLITSDQFAPGWQAHAKPLINMGPTRTVDRTKWFVPGLLARGEYVLVQRDGDKAEVIDGYRVTVKGGLEKQYMLLEPGYGNVEALPIADVPALKPHMSPSAAALQ
ncbi:hypothetical protein [Scleromatobacter humisilvae]|uniref:Uncharacterized protein n=1 Tax=Scleromatobacter humisilvae TaxID=2897159 RepID=A0A9X1YP06_9BURK|nr:hypothetical protein [Scleromatobacter humisilvae]MCK9685101.1 hypothetical protein [Scleromatobacter humisilvae]